MTATKTAGSALLVGENLRRDDVDQPWEQDNQAWWDWYVSLADNTIRLDGATGGEAGAGEATATPSFRSSLGLDAAPADDATLARELREAYPLTTAQIDFFRRNGYVKLRDVISPGATARLRREMVSVLGAAFATTLDGGVRERFLSVEMVWRDNPLVRSFVLSPRIAGIGARLLGVPRVRLYHDNLMSKEPGCGRTPWHHDDHHFPLDTHDVVTAWIPAQGIPRSMGPLAFAAPIDAWQLVRHVPFSKFDASYDRRVDEIFRANGLAVESGPFAVGEVSFHHNLSFHSAGANGTPTSRVVLANTYYVDGARTVASPTMVSGDWQKFMPGVGPGEIAATELNPICWTQD